MEALESLFQYVGQHRVVSLTVFVHDAHELRLDTSLCHHIRCQPHGSLILVQVVLVPIHYDVCQSSSHYAISFHSNSFSVQFGSEKSMVELSSYGTHSATFLVKSPFSAE